MPPPPRAAMMQNAMPMASQMRAPQMQMKSKKMNKNALFDDGMENMQIMQNIAMEEQMNTFGFTEVEKTSEYVETQWLKEN